MEPDLTGENEETRKYLVFKVGRFSLALPIEFIIKVYDTDGLALRRPGSRVLDIYQLTGAQPNASPGYWIEMEAGNRRYHIPVEDVEEIKELSLAVPMPYPRALKRPETRYMKRVFFDGFRMIVEVDPEKIDETVEDLGRLGTSAKKRRKDEEKVHEEGPAPKALAPSKKVLTFEAGADVFAVDIDAVLQIIGMDEIHPVPAAGQRIEGVIYYSDQAVPVVSPGMLRELGKGEGDEWEATLIIIAETKKGAVGVSCNRVLRVVEKNSGEQESAMSHGGSFEGALYIEPDKLIEGISGK